jgi:glutamyl-tRNA synthetase
MSDSPTVRTRIAPSPTGDPHVGTAYVALVNYCFARKHGGEFLLRIEDTDRARSTAESEAAILRALRWAGLSWDEGPDVGGPAGPYRQSERSEIYRRHADELLGAGKAFRCFCTAERLDEMRETQRLMKMPPRYDGRCLGLDAAESRRRAAAGEAFTVRMRIPERGTCIVRDLRRGDIPYEWAAIDMQVLLKSDGMPTYHLANVVDDHLMRITHVIRGEEWISSAPKHLLLYEYFGWTPPVLMHLPLLRNPDRSKLSKRKNPTGILFYERMGYLPEALLNFLGLLISAVPEGEEKFDLAALIARFDIEHVPLGGPVFDTAKLDWLNGRYIRELTPSGLLERLARWSFGKERLEQVAALAVERVERLSDVIPAAAYLFAGRLPLRKEQFAGTKLDDDSVRRALALAIAAFDAEPVFDRASIERVLKGTAETLGRKFRDLARVYYVAITGSPTSLPLFESMELLGRDLVRERLRGALDVLGGAAVESAA